MNQAYQALINSIDDYETTCPACNTKGIHNLKAVFIKKRKYMKKATKVYLVILNFVMILIKRSR